MHIYVAHSEGDFSAEVRTIAGAAQLRLTVPEPARLALDLVGVAAIALVGVWRLHVRRARAVRGDRLS
jgi:hypothetical protein